MGEREVLTTVRGLHVPDALGDCDGCDHAGDPPRWPCRTAELVFTPAEIRRHRDRFPHAKVDQTSDRDELARIKEWFDAYRGIYEKSAAKRRRLIRKEHARGVGPAELASMSGLSGESVDKIISGDT